MLLPKLRDFLGQGVRYHKLKFAYLQALVYFSVIAVILTLVLSPIGERILSKLYLDKAPKRDSMFLFCLNSFHLRSGYLEPLMDY